MEQLDLFGADELVNPALKGFVPAQIFSHATKAWHVPFVALDIETTGLSPKNCGVVEIGAYRFVPGSSEVHTFETFVNPGMPIPAAASQVHGIYDAQVANAPTLAEAMAALVQFVGACPLVLHNGPFDLSFLKPAAERHRLRWAPFSVHDTLALSRQTLPGLRSYSLENLALMLGLEEGGHHRALKDCEYTAKLFTLLLGRLDPHRELTMGDFGDRFGTRCVVDEGCYVW